MRFPRLRSILGWFKKKEAAPVPYTHKLEYVESSECTYMTETEFVEIIFHTSHLDYEQLGKPKFWVYFPTQKTEIEQRLVRMRTAKAVDEKIDGLLR